MRNKIVLGRRAVPKRVTLPNGTTFVSRYKKISRKNLLGSITVSRTRTIGPRNKRRAKPKQKKVRFALANTPTQDRARRIRKKYRISRGIGQIGSGLVSSLANLGLKMGSKAINPVLGKKLINKDIENIPNMVKYGTSKIRNKTVQRVLNKRNKQRNKQCSTCKRDKSNNFVGVFPSNYMNKFIDHAAMISSKRGKYQFAITNTDSSNKQGTHWWSIPDIEPKAD